VSNPEPVEMPQTKSNAEKLRARLTTGRTLRIALVLVLVCLPLYLGDFWMQLGLLVFVGAIGAIGLSLLTGVTGQLSLAHSFFMAIGAYGYAALAGKSQLLGGGVEVQGGGLPPLVAALLAVCVAGLAGLAFSPISGRLSGIYLGVASLALVFFGHHILFNAHGITGGYYGRNAPPFEVLGFGFTDADPFLAVLGIPLGRSERLWYLGLITLVLLYIFARNLLAGRTGRALETIRDNALAAGVMGVNVRRYKALAFVISSMYAGVGGVLLAVAVQRPVPEYFGLMLSVTYLVMIVIGGMASPGGAIAGATFVVSLPLVLAEYSADLPFFDVLEQRGFGPGEFSGLVFGVVVIAVVMLAPGGLASVFKRQAPSLGSASRHKEYR